MKQMIAIVIAAGLLAGCSNLTPGENSALGGTAAGATGGAILGAVAGNAGLGTAIGAGAGLVGGLIYNKVRQDNQNSYNEGYQAGKTSR
jgi:uncharacterized membrane protein